MWPGEAWTSSEPTTSPASIVRVGRVSAPLMPPRSLVCGSSGSIDLSRASSRASRAEISTSTPGSFAASASRLPM